MEFGTREILIILGVVVIFGILLDGFRRVRRSRSGSLRISRRKQAIFDDEDINDLPPELPTGQVRVKRRDEQSVEAVSDNIKRFRERNAGALTSAYRERTGQEQDPASFQAPPREEEAPEPPPAPEESPLESAEAAPVEPPELPPEPCPPPREESEAPRVSLDEFAVEEEPENGGDEAESPVEEDGGRKEPTFAMGTEENPPPEPQPAQPAQPEQPFRVEADDERSGDRHRPFWEEKESASSRSGGTVADREKRAGAPDPGDVIILHVMAKKDQVFQGRDLLEALLANHLRFGSMQIFHRHENKDGSGPVLFSLANSLNPGTFDLAAMEEFETPGVTLFMALENLANPLEAYRELIKSAQNLAKSLNGVLQDETRSALTKQTIEHNRQQIIEYTRRSFTLTN